MKLPAPSLLDRAITAVAPGYGVRRYNARVALHYTGQYAGARSQRAALKNFTPRAGSADSDTLGDLPTLRARSRDLDRNNPIAVGAKATARSHTVGTGLRLRSEIDRDLLGITEEEADTWERRAEKLFHLWALSNSCDITLTQNFYELQGLLFDAVFESGDAFVLRRRAKRSGIIPLALSIVEADRVYTPDTLSNDTTLRSGVRIDEDGAPISYIVANDHPGDSILGTADTYREVLAFGALSGERMALHVFRRRRPDQTRGVPELAPVIETLKQLDRYTEAELMGAVVASFFTVFLKTEGGDDGLQSMQAGALGAGVAGLGPKDITMGPGAVVGLGTNESIEVANPQRANANFDAFFSAVVRQIGVALSIPYELLIMHFTASYSASRAALEMAAQFFKERRAWLVSTFCQPVYEWFLIDAINTGLIKAPGFFDDPVKRAAWTGAMWIPPSRLVLDPKKEWDAEETAMALGAKTLEEVTLEKTGGDWKQKTEQRGREHAARVGFGLEPAILDPAGTGTPDPDGSIEGDTSDDEGTKRKRRPNDADS